MRIVGSNEVKLKKITGKRQNTVYPALSQNNHMHERPEGMRSNVLLWISYVCQLLQRTQLVSRLTVDK